MDPSSSTNDMILAMRNVMILRHDNVKEARMSTNSEVTEYYFNEIEQNDITRDEIISGAEERKAVRMAKLRTYEELYDSDTELFELELLKHTIDHIKTLIAEINETINILIAEEMESIVEDEI